MDWLTRQLVATQAELTEERNLLSKLVFNLEAGVTYLNRELVYQIVNPYFAQMFNRRPEDFLGKKLFETFPETEGQMGHAFETAIKTGRQQTLTRFPLVYQDQGAPKHTFWNTTITPIYDDSGQLMGLLTLAFNATDTVKLEQLLRDL
jgi:PAS domain-containing protein